MKKNKFWNKFSEDMIMNSKTAKDFSYWEKMRNLELKCELENWNLFDCTETGKIISLNTYYTTKEKKKMKMDKINATRPQKTVIFSSEFGKLERIGDVYTITWTEKTFGNETYIKYTNALQEWAWRINFMHKIKEQAK